MVSMRVGQLPRDGAALADAHLLEAGRDTLGQVAEATERERTIPFVDQHRMVRRGFGPTVDELPHRAGALDDLPLRHAYVTGSISIGKPE